MVSMSAHSIALTHVVLRGLQCVASLVALSSISRGFVDTFDNGFSHRVGSPAANIVLIASYTSMMYSLWYMVCVELYPLAPRPRILMMRAMDTATIALLVLASVIFAQSDVVMHCESYGVSLRCGSISASLMFMILTLVLFVATIALTYVKNEAENELTAPPVGYVVETTPTSAIFSPRAAGNAPPTPSSKV